MLFQTSPSWVWLSRAMHSCANSFTPCSLQLWAGLEPALSSLGLECPLRMQGRAVGTPAKAPSRLQQVGASLWPVPVLRLDFILACGPAPAQARAILLPWCSFLGCFAPTWGQGGLAVPWLCQLYGVHCYVLLGPWSWGWASATALMGCPHYHSAEVERQLKQVSCPRTCHSAETGDGKHQV